MTDKYGISDSLKDLKLTVDDLHSVKRREVEEIPLSRITSDPTNPRTSFDDGELAALAQSIKKRGLLQPVTLRKTGRSSYVVRFGDRRFRTAKLAGLETISAIVSDGASDGDLIGQVVENEQRAGLSNCDMAAAVTRLAEQGLTQEQIATRIGRPRSAVAQYAAIGLMPEVLTKRANETGVRPLYDLYQLWLKSPVAVEEFLASGREITGSAVRQLASAQGGSLERSLPVLTNDVSETAAHGSNEDSEAASTEVESGGGIEREPSSIVVHVGGRSGRLVSPLKVKVLFDGEDRAVSVPTEHLLG